MTATNPVARALKIATEASNLLDRILFGHDDDRPVTAEETRRAEGTQHAQAAGEVSADPSPDPAPSPADYSRMADSALLARAADDIDAFALRVSTVQDLNDLLNLADELRDRAAQFAALESLDTK